MDSLPHNNNEVQPQTTTQDTSDGYEYIRYAKKLAKFHELGKLFYLIHYKLESKDEFVKILLSALLCRDLGNDWHKVIEQVEEILQTAVSHMGIDTATNHKRPNTQGKNMSERLGVFLSLPIEQRLQMTPSEIAECLDVTVNDAIWLIKKGTIFRV